MINYFRKLLIRFGKIIPFLLAAIVCFGYLETIYAVAFNVTIDVGIDFEMYYTPISNYIGSIIYTDVFDVILLYILSVALEFCWRNKLAVHYLTLNLAVRYTLETLSPDGWAILPLCIFMALFGLFCVYGGFKMIKVSKL